MQNTYTHTHLKWKHGNLVAPENPCKFQRFSCILQCTLCHTFMITTPEVQTSLLSLVPINTLLIIRNFGSGKYSNASMYVCVCICICIYVYISYIFSCSKAVSYLTKFDNIFDEVIIFLSCWYIFCKNSVNLDKKVWIIIVVPVNNFGFLSQTIQRNIASLI